jgi:hypothetical protein
LDKTFVTPISSTFEPAKYHEKIIFRRFGSAIYLPVFVKLSEKHFFIFFRIFDVHKHWHFKVELLSDIENFVKFLGNAFQIP